MNNRGPILISSFTFPPVAAGSAIVCRNLWKVWPSDDIVVLSELPVSDVDPELALPNVRISYINTLLLRAPRIYIVFGPLAAFLVRQRLLALAQRYRPRAIWANWPKSAFLIGAWHAARELGLPLYVHMHDMWEEGVTRGRQFLDRKAARFYERRVLQGARRVFAITDAAANHFRVKHNVDAYVLQHCIPDEDLLRCREGLVQDSVRNVLHFAGAIYSFMNADAIVNAANALKVSKSGMSLDIFTRNPGGLESLGIGGASVCARFAPKAEVMAAQRDSALLLLPLAFQSPGPVEIRTVIPAKLLEYLVSGRPILVHAPADSWASRAARRDGWGLVVDQPDPAKLANAIDALVKDPAKQHQLVVAAFAEARRRLASVVAAGLKEELVRLEQCNA